MDNYEICDKPTPWRPCTLTYQIYFSYFVEGQLVTISAKSFKPVHEISNNVVCATSKASDQPAHTHSLTRAFASRLSIL